MKFLIVMGLGRYTVGLEKGGKIVHGVELLVGELWELPLAHLYPLTACSSQEPWVKLLQSTCYKENEWQLFLLFRSPRFIFLDCFFYSVIPLGIFDFFSIFPIQFRVHQRICKISRLLFWKCGAFSLLMVSFLPLKIPSNIHPFLIQPLHPQIYSSLKQKSNEKWNADFFVNFLFDFMFFLGDTWRKDATSSYPISTSPRYINLS